MSYENDRTGLSDSEREELDNMARGLFGDLFAKKARPEPEAKSASEATAEFASVVQDVTAVALGVHTSLIEGGVSKEVADTLMSQTYVGILSTLLGGARD